MLNNIPWAFIVELLVPILVQTTLKYYIFVPPAAKMYRLHAVLRFEGMETYYRRLRLATFGPPPQEFSTTKEKIRARKMTCKSILNSYFFEMIGEEYVDVDSVKVREELKNFFPDIFHSLYKEREYRTNIRVWGDSYEYDSDYTIRTVSILGSNEDEYVITCLARGRHSRRFKKYFVTQPYNVNSVHHDTDNIHGRFVFSRRSNGNLGLVAMAEEAAYQWWLLRESKFSPLIYMLLRKLNPKRGMYSYLRPFFLARISKVVIYLAAAARQDPICKLSDVNKLRLCTSLFGDPMFRRKGFEFKPTLKNVLTTCVRKQIVLLEPVFNGIPLLERWERTMRRPFRTPEEWTIGCKALSSKGDRVIFYVSRAVAEHEIFVYKKSPRVGHATLYTVFMNLSVVDRLRPSRGENVETFIFDDVED